jgi:hypothetical protein
MVGARDERGVLVRKPARRDDVEGSAVEFCEVVCCDVGWAQLNAARTVMSLGVLEIAGNVFTVWAVTAL